MKIRKLIVILLLVLVLLAVLLSAWWMLSGERWLKDKVEGSVAELTGRSFSINGAFSVDLSANPLLVAEDIRLSNPDWARNPDLARLDSLEVSLELASILSKPVRLNFINLDGLVIALEERDSGEKSWEFPSEPAEPSGTTDDSSSELPVSVGHVSLTGFSLKHESPERTAPLDFRLSQLDLTQKADWQIFIDTDGQFGGEQFGLDGNMGPLDALVAGGKVGHEIRLNVGDIVLESRGHVEQLETLSGANIDLAFSGPEFEWITTQLALPTFSHGDFDFKLNVRTEGENTYLDLDGDLGSLQARAKGESNDLTAFDNANLTADITGDDLGSLFELAGINGVAHKPFNVKIDMGRAAGLYRFQTLELVSGENAVSVSGQMGDWPRLENTNLDFAVTGPDLSAWSPILGSDKLPATAFSLTGGVTPTDSGLNLEGVSFKLGDSQLVVNGLLGKWPEFNETALKLEASGSSLKNIGDLLDFQLPDEPFKLNTRLKGSPSEFRAEPLDIELGGSDLSGDVSVNLVAKPIINSVLRSNHMDLSWLKGKDKADSSNVKPEKKSKQDLLIPDSPIEISAADVADIDVDISIKTLALPKMTFYGVNTHTRTKDGDLFVDRFQLSGEEGGQLKGNMVVKREPGSDITSAVLSVEGKGVKLGIGAAEGQDPDTIRETELVANLSGAGITYRDLAKSLDGRIEVIQGPGLTESAGLSLIFGNFIGELLSALNPFSETEQFVKNECVVGIVNIESGFLTAEPLVSHSEKMTIAAKGAVDLHTEEMQFTFNTKLRKGIGISASMVVNPFVSITGTLASPVIGLDPSAVAVKGTVAVATVGISLLAKSLSDRFLSSKDPCGDALKKSREAMNKSAKKGKGG